MKTRFIFTLLVLILFHQVFCLGQNPDETVLMNVAGRDVQTGEFIRMYNKSLDPGNKTELTIYLRQFIDFKLKVADALARGYDTTKGFKDELAGYRNQLAQSYLTDPDIKQKLLHQAYDRSLFEVKASHILVNCPPDAPSDDTLRAYQKAIGIRERIINGETFEQVARATSDDKSVLLNGGSLGYFTVFQMITPFEEAAYNLKPGTLSMPVRTPFGYHIIMVADKRPSRGKVKVAHIMKAAPPGSDEKKVQRAREEIDSVYSYLTMGRSFRELAAKYSDHKESASKGGELDWFGAGEIISDFSEAAFSISDTGEYTKPVRTFYGFHIIKLLGKKAPASFDELKSYLESKINQSNLTTLGKKSFISRIKKDYNFTINKTVYDWFVNNTDTLIIDGLAKYNTDKIIGSNIYSFADQSLTAPDFAKILEKRGNMVTTKDPKYFIDISLESLVSDNLIQYENSILEKKFHDFRYLMNEFHDGILLFDISSEMVWNKVQEDSAGLRGYYNEHKNDFLSKRGIEAKIYTLKDPGGSEHFISAFKRFSAKTDPDKRLNDMFNRKNDTILSITESKWYSGDDVDIDSIQWTPGIHTFKKNGLPSILFIKRVLEPEPLLYNQVQAEVISGYQDWLMDNWIKQLKEKYPVRIDNLVLEEIRKRLNNE